MSLLLPEKRCVHRVFSSDGSFLGYQCSRGGVNEENGKLFCKQHTPSLVAAKEEARRQKWREQWSKDRKDADEKRKKIEDEKNELADLRAMKKALIAFMDFMSVDEWRDNKGNNVFYEISCCRGPSGESTK